MKYILDGYNVTHKILALQGKRLRTQREGLLRLLEFAQAQDKRLKDLTVVFDGKSDVSAPRMNSTVKIIFTKNKSADKKIKEIVESSGFARDIGVVSDDRQIRHYASSIGAKKIKVADFLKMTYAAFKRKVEAFKLDEKQVKEINRELEKVWLNG